MHSEITACQVIDRLEESKINYELLPLQNGCFAILSERGGRILGPFLEQGGRSLLWTNAAFAQPQTFKKFLASGNWNLGGERNWIAPEIQYLVKDRNNVEATVFFPEQMDPGNFTLMKIGEGRFQLSADMNLEAWNTATGEKRLHLESRIMAVEDPLRFTSSYRSLQADVAYFGYQQSITLTDLNANEIMSELWNLIQLNPGGEVLLPISSGWETTQYAGEPPGEDLARFRTHCLGLKITGSRLYKIGYKASQHFGRLAYLNSSDVDRSYLIIRNFSNNPSSYYVEEPADRPGKWGDSIHIYNDDGRWGGFGELEVHGQTIGGRTDIATSTDSLMLWFYTGPKEKLINIAYLLLGVDLQHSS